MPPFETPPTDRIPTPGEFIAEALRRNAYDPRAAGITAMVEQIVRATRGHGSADPDGLREHLRMGALLALIVDERFDEITAQASGIQPPPEVVGAPRLSWAQLLRVFGEEDQ